MSTNLFKSIIKVVKCQSDKAGVLLKSTLPLLKKSRSHLADSYQKLATDIIKAAIGLTILYAINKIEKTVQNSDSKIQDKVNDNYLYSKHWRPVCIRDCVFQSDYLSVGYERGGIPIYLGTSLFNGDVIPCKVVIDRKEAYVPYGGIEYKVEKLKMCCIPPEDVTWIPSELGKVHKNAIPIGRTINGENLYVGRVQHDHLGHIAHDATLAAVTPGKIHPSHGCLYIPYNGEELKFEKGYEIMIKRSNDITLTMLCKHLLNSLFLPQKIERV